MLSVPISGSPPSFHQGLGDSHGTMHSVTHARICVLSIEHDDLDRAINAFAAANRDDDLAVTRLKKRKLRIRDEIAQLLTAPMEVAHG